MVHVLLSLLVFISIPSFGQSLSLEEANKLLHESIVLTNEWDSEKGMDLCNEDKYQIAIANGADLNSQSHIYHKKAFHQNAFNRAIAYTCKELAMQMLNDISLQNELLASKLVNDPDRVLTPAPISRMINKNYIELYKKVINKYELSKSSSQIARSLVQKDREEMLILYLDSIQISDLNEIYSAIKLAVVQKKSRLLNILLNHNSQLKRLSLKRVEKLRELNTNDECLELLSQY